MNRFIALLHERDNFLPTAAAVGVLLIGLTYILTNVYLVPYPGFNYDGQWNVISLATNCESVSSPRYDEWCRRSKGLLHVGDRILAIEDRHTDAPITVDDYQNSLFFTPFWLAKTGDTVQLLVERGDQQLQVAWPVQGPTPIGQIRRLAALLLLLPFWLAGTATLLFLRPRDTRWYALILFNYITALWLVIGTTSVSQVLGASLLTTFLAWLLVPAFLHLHFFIAERKSSPFLNRSIAVAYAAVLVLGALEVMRIIPARASYLALLGAILGSVSILVYRLTQPSARAIRAANGLMLTGIVLAILPGTLFWLVPAISGTQRAPSLAIIAISTFAIPILPFFYFYALYKHRLGNLEVRANRALTQYSFLILFSTSFVLTFVLLNNRSEVESSVMLYALGLSVLFMFLSFVLRPPFKRLVNRIAYGTSYEPESVIRQFANAIPRALSRQQLSSVLVGELMPSLLIRQSALLWLNDTDEPLIYGENSPPLDLPLSEADLAMLLNNAKKFLPAEEALPGQFAWIRVIVPIELDQKPVGLWLLGRRDPDDFYPYRDIELVMTLGNQVGVALETVRLFAIQQQRAEELENAYYKLRQADRLKNDFIRNITHELRTPLTAISGYTDLLSDGDAGDLNKMQQEMLAIVSARSADLIRLINDIITFQETKLQQEEGEVVDLKAVAATAVKHAQLMAEKDASWQPRPHKITLTQDDDAPLIWGNPMQIGQVFTNLLQNAIKFSPDGGNVQVRIYRDAYNFPENNFSDGFARDSATTEPGVAVFASVSDEGIGIPPDELEKIWHDFYQIDGSATRRFGGTGLGLALVRDIIETHGGFIWVHSAVGQGSTFTFALPRQLEVESPNPPERQTAPPVRSLEKSLQL